jgi:hypothetical protein
LPQKRKPTYPSKSVSPPLISAFNRAAGALSRIGLGPARLDHQQLIAQACRRTGLSDFGEGEFTEPLRILVESLERDADLTPIGRIVARAHLSRLLTNRLRLEAERRRTPQAAHERILPVLIITGLPRSGTSFLHSLLTQDPASRAPRVWETILPCPAPERAARDSDPRIAAAARQIRWVNRLAPRFDAIHTLRADRPQECIAITGHSFLSPVFETMYWVRSYGRWLERQDLRRAYRFHRRFLQHLQSGYRAARWVLKAPDHLFSLGPLVETYPGAMIVQTIRDPQEVLPSVASLLATLRGAFSDRVDPRAVGREVLSRWSRGLDQARAARRDPAIGADRFLDVHYEDLVSDPIRVINRIYEYFELTLTEAAERRMQAHLARLERGRQSRHNYRLETFGLGPDEVDALFPPSGDALDRGTRRDRTPLATVPVPVHRSA